MKQFKCTIELENDTMKTRADIARALRELAKRVVKETGLNARIMDTNGNTVGHWEITL